MAISFDSERKIFKLDTLNSSYLIEIFDEGYLLHLHYGGKIPDTNAASLRNRGMFASFSPNNYEVQKKHGDQYFSPDLAPMEYSCNGTGDFRISALQIKNHNGDASTDIRYVGHKIYQGKPELKGLPATYANEDEAETLEIYTEDKVTGAFVTLIYTVYENFSVMTRSVKVENKSDFDMDIERVYSCCVEFPSMDYKISHLYGQWFKERTLTTRPLSHGIQSIQSKRGSSSHNHNPFMAVASLDATEDFGEAYGFNFVYSSNFDMSVEVDARNTARFIGGINPSDFSWKLIPGDEFVAPEMVMVYSDGGYGQMSRIFHKFYMKHLIRSEWRDIKRPILINSWEAAYFNFDDDKLVAFAAEAKELGIDMLVMDDGWFGVRNLDNCSLGDWYVNENKLKGGIGSLIKRVNDLGLKFGIWYEPEMISPDSDLYRAHPDWCIQVKGRDKSIARLQYVLDMSRKEVVDNIFEQMSNVLANNNIEYVKWDFNRNLTEIGSLALPADRQKEVAHRFMLGTYELMDRFTKAFPHILFENCSGGGGRFDPGMLYYSPQIWCSDNTDAIERLTIQFGSSMCYPVSTFGAHVAHRPRTPLRTRGDVALCGTFGYELDPRKLTDEEKAIVKEQVAEYHKYNNVIHKGDMYRLINPTDDAFHCAWEFVSEDKKEALVTVVTMRQRETPYFVLRLKGLDENTMYRDEATGEVYSGAFLMKAGINAVPTGRGQLDQQPGTDGSSVKKYFVAI